MSTHVRHAEISALISAAQARYVREIDDGDCTAWPSFFVDDCFYTITSADNYAQNFEAGLVWLDSKDMLRDRILSLLEANVYERHSYRHLIGQPFVGEVDGDEVDSETAFMVARITREGPTDLFASGRYIDRYRVIAGEAKIVSRTVVLDSNRIDTLLGFPL
ncbi:aromatic-ring-hydroxylating dioxygenase subunit beta [Pelagibacterium halotolerans]|uniref:Ortho-halobenzoate 1,2-dioxygenase beta-ISP protein OhbA n=1 Tax=Pelagibacterium halotolerans (strain DSM 22347 / JCM 15775 / CGMCC 1.7692 / B2) TaxID=1082931 RepID=G4RBH2_PELHB|nr:aromatic-ring-hydroxylating dioxygenase subunit beta [Pelagibacterium halotolerans]AEQ52648.1 ortho-halobenzoate 1,2-dioxygenase beta-ISP protein OhbA [Pelagibacterium halotolerans B2]QJR17648.1 aromatic-ring-hydroxylating dioxygenase subunit beta [Pelagibacterium halotolerans]SEA83777.1 terephthalate 1,2-dioxygenase, beta subunit [Pelagibacterium halotolerans]